MFPYLSAVMPQIAYAHSVRDFIRELLRRFIPGKWIDRVISDQDANFDAKLGAAFASLDEMTATEKDYCAKVVSVLCDEVSSICEVTRLVCINRGYRKYADTFLSTDKFVRLLLRQDPEKIERLNAALADRSKPLCVLLRDVGAVLEDKASDDGATFGAAEIRKANAELKAIAADVKKTITTGIAEVRHDIAAVGEKVDCIKHRAKRRGKYDDVGSHCLDIWEIARADMSLRNSLNTRVTYEAVFARHKGDLEKSGIDTVEKFKKVIHAAQSKRSSDNIKKLESRQDKARQSNNQTLKQPNNQNQTIKQPTNQTINFGIICGMKKNAKSALALTLAIAGGLASPLRSDATNHGFTSALSRMLGISHFKLMAS